MESTAQAQNLMCVLQHRVKIYRVGKIACHQYLAPEHKLTFCKTYVKMEPCVAAKLGFQVIPLVVVPPLMRIMHNNIIVVFMTSICKNMQPVVVAHKQFLLMYSY